MGTLGYFGANNVSRSKENAERRRRCALCGNIRVDVGSKWAPSRCSGYIVGRVASLPDACPLLSF
jgi:hypothetical protein